MQKKALNCSMELDADVLIIGGGLAGLTSAIHLCKKGIRVAVIEKQTYPNHKVCGEYISNEVIPYLQWLDADPIHLNPNHITEFELSTENGKSVRASLPLGGFGISRYTFDQFLYEKASEIGCILIQGTANDINFHNDWFIVTTSTQNYTSKMVLGAFGKRTTLDHKLERKFIGQKSPWLAIKAHYKGYFDNNTVALHHFKGGYCGVSKVENDIINICYLVNYSSFKDYKNVEEHRLNVVCQNKHLKRIFNDSEMLFDEPLSIGQISFENKEKVKNHILMIGDSAGLIHPLCGNGMSMAIHSAKICSILLIAYFEKKISRQQVEDEHAKQWSANFGSRIATGRILANVLKREKLSNLIMTGLVKFPALLPLIIKRTHGKP